MNSRELVFKAMSWVYEDREMDMVIHVSGMTPEGKTVQIQIEKFTPFCYLQLPKRIVWTKDKCKTLFNHFVANHKSMAPLNYSLKKKKNLYFRKEGNFMMLTFATNEACRKFESKCSKKQYISGLGTFNLNELLVHEHNIDPVLKIASMKNILLSGWVKVVETIPEEEQDLTEDDRKFSYADIDMYVNYQDIHPYEMKEHIIITPMYCSFDIECYSVNHNSKLPDPKISENEIFQIALVFGKMGSDEEQKTYLLTRFNPYDIEGCRTIRFKTEKALLLSFTELIKKLDPLFFIGYNIMKFDWDYMISRADKLGILDKFLELTRIIGKKATIDKINWSSSAYKQQEFRYPGCIGRIHLDVLIEVERNFKLPTYSLNVVAGKFLGEQKDDISPRQLFMFYKITKELLPILEKEELSDDRLKELQKRIKEIFPFRQSHGIVRRHRRHMLNCSTQVELTKLVRECLTMTLKYCRQDTILPIKIIEKLNLLTTMEEMSNVMHIPMSYLHTRGQQIKVLAQVFRETIHNGIIIPHHRKVKGAPKENYEGAIVAEAHAGDYRNVGTLDFCITGDTPIATQNGYSIPLKNITKNMRVNGWNGESYGWYSSEGVIYKGKKETVKVWLQDGTTIECTPDHKFMLDNGEWCRADELKGKYVKCGLEQPLDSICEKEGSWEMHMDGYILTMKTEQDREDSLAFSRLLGYILSDGSIYETTDKNGRTRKCCEVSMGTMIDAEDIMKDIVRFNVPRVTIRKRSRGVKGTTYCITIPAKLSKAIHSIDGIVKGKRATQPMFLPSFILEERCPKSIQREFLAGLFGGDGTAPFYQKGRNSSMGTLSFKWTTIEKYKENMVLVFNQLQKLLSNFSIETSKSETKIKYGENAIKPKETEGEQARWDVYLMVQIDSIIAYQKNIGFRYCINKCAKLTIAYSFYKTREVIREQHTKVLLIVNKLIEDKEITIRNALEEARKITFFNEPPVSELSLSSVKDIYWRRGEAKKHPERAKNLSLKNEGSLISFLEETQTLDWFTTEVKDKKYAVPSDSLIVPSFRKKVIGVFDNGVQDVYDIFEVEKVHNFLAGGITGSNCSLYPTTMIAFNICYSTLATDPSIPDEECHILKWTSHVGCIHDPKKRKKKDKDGNNIVICGEFRHRFLKVKLSYDEKTKTIYRENEGVMPKLERNLLSSRSDVKKEMLKAEARLKMTRGEASEDDLEFYRFKKFEIIPKGHLSKEEEKKLDVYAGVLNAKQLAIKVSANSAYGALGAGDGFIPLIAGAASVTAMGRDLITSAIKKIRDTWSNCKPVYGDSVTGDTPITIRDRRTSLIHIIPISQFSDFLLSAEKDDADKLKWKDFPLFKLDGEDRREKERIDVSHFEIWGNGKWFPIRRLIRHKVNKKIYRVQTGNGVVDVTEDHSLLTEKEEMIKPKDVNIGGRLLTSFPQNFQSFYKIEKKIETAFEQKIKCKKCLIEKIVQEYHKCNKVCKSCRKTATKKGFIHYVSEYEYFQEKEVTVEEAWVWGFFMADGSCGKYKTKSGNKNSWAINNQNLEFLNKAKKKIEQIEPYTFRILDTLKSSGVYKLVPIGGLKLIVQKYRKLFYNEKKKIVPLSVLNGSFEIRQSFFDGYYTGDGCKEKDEYTEFTAKGKLSCHHLYYLAKSIGYNNLCIREHTKKDDIYSVRICKTAKKRNDVRKRRVIHESYDDYVYDIETESGQFHAGLGEIILKNTDSCMLVFENATLRESFDLCKKASRVVTHYLKSRILGYDETLLVKTKTGKEFTLDKIAPFSNHFEELEHPDKIKILEYDSIPTDLSFECMYGRFLLLTKKRYIAYKVNEDGQVVDITKKGVVLSRRDNSLFLKIVYKYVSDGILNMKSEEEVMYTLYDEIHKLFTRRVPDTNLIIPVGVNKLIDYAKKKKYTVGEKEVVFFIDKNGNPIEEPNGPLDPRLVYPNLPQVLLSLKMIRRGTDVPSNTRLEQIFLENKHAIHQGDKAEDYTYYKENRMMEGLKIDYLHYIDKIQEPIMELLNVKYPRTIRVHYEKLEDAIKRVLSMDIDPYKRSKIANTSSFIKEVSKYREWRVGWDAFEDKTIKKMFCNLPPASYRTYISKGILAKVEYVLSSHKRGESNDFTMEDPMEAEIIDVCRKYKAKCVMDALCTQFKARKRVFRKPTQFGNKIIKNTGIYFTKGEKKGSYGFILDLHLIEGIQPTDKEKKYLFDIQLEQSQEILFNVPRDHFTTYHLKDSQVMKNIYEARFNYKKVVEEFKTLSNPVILPDDI